MSRAAAHIAALVEAVALETVKALEAERPIAPPTHSAIQTVPVTAPAYGNPFLAQQLNLTRLPGKELLALKRNSVVFDFLHE